MVCSLVSLEMGGKTPLASQVSSMIFEGWFGERQGIFAFAICSIGYALSSISKTNWRNLEKPVRTLPSGVLRQSRVIIVDHSRFGRKDHVFENCTESDRIVDVWLLLRR